MTWSAKYNSPFHPQTPPTSDPRYTDEQVAAMLTGMLIDGRNWAIAEAEDGRILLRQHPPHGEWTWEFFRLDA